MNLDMTIAVTHNYASTATFPRIWRHTRKGRPKMAARWYAADGACIRPFKAVMLGQDQQCIWCTAHAL